MLLKEGQVIRDTYEVERLLGEGAFAEVYRVRHRFLGRQALKLFKTAGMIIAELGKALSEALNLQIAWINNSGFAREIIDEAFRRMAAPIREQIKIQSARAVHDAEDSPFQVDDVTIRLLEQCGSLLSIFDKLAHAGQVIGEGARDQVALAALDCQSAFASKVDNWKFLLSLRKSILSVATSASAKAKIQAKVERAEHKAETGNYWCGDGYNHLPVPVLQYLETALEKAQSEELNEAVMMLADLLAGRTEVCLDEGLSPLAQKPLAYCLNRRAASCLNQVVEWLEEEPAIILQVRERSEGPNANFTRTLQAIRNHMVSAASSIIHYLAYDARISGKYFEYDDDMPFILARPVAVVSIRNASSKENAHVPSLTLQQRT